MIITKVEIFGKIHGVKVSRTSPPISHFIYADDLSIYSKASSIEAKEISNCLKKFNTWSGYLINISKPLVYFSKNVDHIVKTNMLNILGMLKC